MMLSNQISNFRKFIGKQTDEESRLADHGARKYDKVLGQFTCPDTLWEKYYKIPSPSGEGQASL
jgi:RHS repeat-associated protein